MEKSYSVLALLSNQKNRRLLEDWIETETDHDVCSAEVEEVRSRDAEFDLCVLDVGSFERHGDWLVDLKEEKKPVILPYLLIVEERRKGILEGERIEYADGLLWGNIDDIINVPLRKHEFRMRLDSLLRLRGQSLEIEKARDEYRSLSQRLETEKTKLQKYLDVSEAIVVGLNLDHKVREINRAGCELLGCDVDDVIGEDWFERFVPDDESEETAEEFESLISDGELPSKYTNPVVTADGEERMIRWRNTVVRDDDGEVKGSLSSGIDVTELYEKREILSVILDVNESIIRRKDRHELVSAVAGILSESRVFTSAFVGLREADPDPELSYYYGEGCDLSDDEIDGFHTPEYVREVFEEDTVVVDDVTQPPYRHHPDDAGVESHAGVGLSLRHNDETFGVLTVHFPPDSPPEETTIDLLEEVSGDLGFALHSIRQEEEVRQREHELQNLIDTIDDAVFVHSIEGDMLEVNRTAVERLGYSEEELLEMSPGEINQPEEAEAVGENIQRLLDEGSLLFETVHVTKDGKEIPVEVNSSLISYFGEDAVLSISRDISRRERKKRYIDLLRTANDIIIRADDTQDLIESVVETVSERSTYGCTSVAVLDETRRVDEIYGRWEEGSEMDWDEIYTDEYVGTVLEEEDGVYVIEDVTQPPEAQHEPDAEVESHGALALSVEHKGHVYGIITVHLPFVASSLSEEETSLIRELADSISIGIYEIETRESLRDSTRRFDVLDRVLRHNMHNKMNVIMGYADSLSESLPEDDRRKAEQIREAAEKLLSTTDKEREIVEVIMEEKSRERANLVEVAETVTQSLSEKYHDAEISTRLTREPAAVFPIPQIGRAVRELVENAVLHNDTDRPEVEVYVERHADSVVLGVADNGPRIPEEEVGVLMGEKEIDPLYHGSGLGLWLVNWIVKKSGGELSFGFEEGDLRGNTVEISLPAVRK
ncbi:MAG: PAS domain S-box protein [Halobacteria archaeon]|nr:PAS domain S-box protein [Halobacteria archaeon]